ncbi:MAG TPA: hypothetical protein VLK27_02345 [Chthoniobacterales bacterium]|nr:hypothetical protein [Chthoniobacterales bacterium]
MFRKIRLGAAIVLICAIFLPLSQCSQNISGGGPKTDVRTPQAFAHSRHLFPQSNAEYEYQYGIHFVHVGFTDPKDNYTAAGLTLIAFLWPLGFAIWSRRSKFPRFWWIFYSIELLLCAGTIYWIWALTMGGRLLYGFWVAEGAITICTITTVIVIIARLRDFLRSGRINPASTLR